MLLTFKIIVSCRLQKGHLSAFEYSKLEHCDYYRNYRLQHTTEYYAIHQG